jgi:hypothetical protein
MLFRAWPAFAATSAGLTAQATAVLEVGTTVAAISAAYYVGACIGALAYAAGHYSADHLWGSNGYEIINLRDKAAAGGITIPSAMVSAFASREGSAQSVMA